MDTEHRNKMYVGYLENKYNGWPKQWKICAWHVRWFLFFVASQFVFIKQQNGTKSSSTNLSRFLCGIKRESWNDFTVGSQNWCIEKKKDVAQNQWMIFNSLPSIPYVLMIHFCYAKHTSLPHSHSNTQFHSTWISTKWKKFIFTIISIALRICGVYVVFSPFHIPYEWCMESWWR